MRRVAPSGQPAQGEVQPTGRDATAELLLPPRAVRHGDPPHQVEQAQDRRPQAGVLRVLSQPHPPPELPG